MANAGLPQSRHRLIAIYGLAHFGKSLFWNTSSLIFAFFLTETVGFSPEVMGYVLAASLFFNACVDFAVGATLGRWVQNSTSAALAQFLGGLIAALAFIAFCAAGFVPAGAQLGYALGAILLFRLGYSFYDVPQNAFMSFASFDDRQRATLASTRYIAAGASILLIALAFAPIIRETDPDLQAFRFLQLAVALAAISALCSGLLLLFARQCGTPSTPAHDGNAAQPASEARADLYPLILGSIFILSFCSPIFTKLEAYFTAFVLDEPLSATFFMACVAGGKVAAQPAWAAFANATSLTTVLRTAALTWGLSAGLFFVITDGWSPGARSCPPACSAPPQVACSWRSGVCWRVRPPSIRPPRPAASASSPSSPRPPRRSAFSCWDRRSPCSPMMKLLASQYLPYSCPSAPLLARLCSCSSQSG